MDTALHYLAAYYKEAFKIFGIVVWVVCVAVGGTLAYCFPWLVAVYKKRRHQGYITAFSMIFGWTIVGWVAALVWALLEKPKND